MIVTHGHAKVYCILLTRGQAKVLRMRRAHAHLVPLFQRCLVISRSLTSSSVVSQRPFPQQSSNTTSLSDAADAVLPLMTTHRSGGRGASPKLGGRPQVRAAGLGSPLCSVEHQVFAFPAM